VPAIEKTLSDAVELAANFIQAQQNSNGEIPWYCGAKFDTWNHSEALMALTLAKRYDAFKLGMRALVNCQNPDGSWWAKYLGDLNDQDLDRRKIESNFVAYPATALWHYYLCTRDLAFTQEVFPTIERALNFVCQLQHEQGDIQWAISELENLPRDALLTACSSILRSMECGIAIAEVLEKNCEVWVQAHSKLAKAIKSKPWRFDRSWESKSRYSMDWFYPVLSGVYNRAEAASRLDQSWDKFIVSQWGCRCVSDEPWVTVAESCEWIIALVASGKRDLALQQLEKLLQWQDSDGGFWTGYQFRDQCIWPREKTTWTAGAFVLAVDAVLEISPARSLFTQPSGLLLAQNGE
jgi:hypothetical protein